MNIGEAMAELGTRVNLSVTIFTVALIMCRVMPILIFSPFLGGEVVPSEMKLGLGLLISIVLFPSVSDRMDKIPISALPYIALLCKEIFIGLCLSYIVNMVFDAARVAGTLMDTMSGSNNAQLFVPQLGTQVSIFSSLKVQLTVVLFLSLDGHHVIIRALADSLQVVPLEGFPRFSHGVWPFFDLMIRSFADLLAVSLALAGPGMVAAFCTDLALGAINRVAPQVQVFFISMSLKPLVGALIMFLSMHVIVGRMQLELGNMLRMVQRAIQLLA
ncbi:flagellar biosynthetic protein FliR [Corallococcus sp. ZKHCc1 1396]|uniref:Flagellar biosynthetic protein FliR n=1 Tax=Corallococcus soli TaxID=2710757 RepID=A0ABR9PT53_9BACT|nr:MULTISPECIES: flagellar biosynthetic protein FliR [Corallococcus]MBE4751108.1 flagellar biosynthetic protein FliR [Corallococcus soli]MCY1034139.1 flagellar biosynthetic protein FliR [Corallococcus sp. BB11-1]